MRGVADVDGPRPGVGTWVPSGVCASTLEPSTETINNHGVLATCEMHTFAYRDIDCLVRNWIIEVVIFLDYL